MGGPPVWGLGVGLRTPHRKKKLLRTIYTSLGPGPILWINVENRVLRRIFGPKKDEVTGGWRKLHNEELRDLYSSPSIIKMIKSMRMRWAGHGARMGEKWNAYRLLVGKPEGKETTRKTKM
jgi:hypothetical protein